MDRQGFEQSKVTAGLPTPQHTTGISGTDPTLAGTEQHRGMAHTGTDTGLGTTGISPTGNTAATVTDRDLGSTETRQTEVTGVFVPVVPIEAGHTTVAGDTAGVTRFEGHHQQGQHLGHEGEKKPMGEKIKEHIPGTQAHKEYKAEKQLEQGRI
ncbi:hypothetical protein OEZ85_011486 [Tetradesmus obliquus]|uniref:Dehydrin n=1 Tax=Tetradesmus obliquus TaxID=3088 RepID=A0ABY8TQH2_TETOB|nr:hypothetical protein OEZ85_011486 [Tetradesmus obliquus]